MSVQSLFYLIKEPYRQLRKSNKVFLNEYIKEFINFSIFGILGGIIAWFLAESFINHWLEGINIPNEVEGIVKTLKVLIAIFTGVVCGSFYLPFYTFYRNKYAFNHLFKIRGDNLNANFRKTILHRYETDINNQLSNLAILTNKGELSAYYSTQFFLADMFSSNAKNYFWATSFDVPSEFPIRNFDYMRKFNNMNLVGIDEENIPKKARIFITTFDDLIEDISENSTYLLELINAHLQYYNSQVICSVKFLVSPNDTFAQIEDIIQTNQIDKTKMIYDFFVLDDKLVYGRKNKRLNRTNECIDISFIGNKTLVTNENAGEILNYKKVFKEIWKVSLDVRSLASLLSDLNAQDEFAKNAKSSISKLASYQILDEITKKISRFAKDALNLWENIEDTQKKEARYGSIFDTAKFGQLFFNKWLNIIETSTGIAWAVDSSERKEGNEFYKIWDNQSLDDYVYREFLKSSSKAAIGGSDFKRIFIINNLIPNGEQEQFRHFLYKTVDTNKLKIGITPSNKTKLSDEEKLYYGDFLMVGISKVNNQFDTSYAKGFTLRNRKFKVEDLSFDFNIMLEKEFMNYQDVFLRLWNDSETVKFESVADTINPIKIQKLIKNSP
jgi:hypothetical protein